jgi:rhodanese-related sulfurtransferase
LSAVDRLLAEARQRLGRVTPRRAKQIMDMGGLIVDIRPAGQRARHGEVPGALIIDRNVLEWRLDPHGTDRIPEAKDQNKQIVIMCQEGYASSLAAASLHDLGRLGATDMEGGFAAWKEAGLPVTPPTHP